MDDEQIREAAKDAKRKYYREYREKNREKIRANTERYWARKALEARKDAETTRA